MKSPEHARNVMDDKIPSKIEKSFEVPFVLIAVGSVIF
jgi:hypothetical protein